MTHRRSALRVASIFADECYADVHESGIFQRISACNGEPRTTSPIPCRSGLELRGVTTGAGEFDAAISRGDSAALEAAVRLYRGPFLEDRHEALALEAGRFLGALERQASQAAEAGDLGAVAQHLCAAMQIDPYREDLLAACAHLRILSSSGGVLGINGKTLWRVPSLRMPESGSNKPVPLADVRSVGSVGIQRLALTAVAAESKKSPADEDGASGSVRI